MGFPRRDDLDPECVQRHYDALTTGLPVHVGRTRDGRGYGLYASRNFESDEEVFVEKALAGMQQAENRAHVLACAHCHRFVGSLPLQAGLLASRVTRGDIAGGSMRKGSEYRLPELPNAEEESMPFAGRPFVLCSRGCGEVYCSRECENADMDGSHWLLCTGPIDSAEHPLVRFKTHACETNDIFLLCAKALAEAITRWRRTAGDIQAAALPLQCFHSAPWWDVVAPGDTDPSLRRQCRDLVADSVGLLREAIKALGHWDEALEPLVSPEFVSELIGAYEMNNIGIQIKSPLQIYVDVARAAGGEAARVAEEFAAEVHAQAEAEAGHNHPGDEADAEDDLSVAPEDTRGSCTAIGEKRHREEHQGGHEEAEGDSEEETGGEDCENEKLGFFDGTGLYSLACMMNHSCEPSVKVLYPEDGMGRGEARIVTLGQLQEGQELLISYIDTRWTRSRRQRELLDGYRFECRCERCNREGQEEAS